MSVESYDTLASDDELNTTRGGRWSESSSSVERTYDEYTAKLEADIDYWTSLAAKYEEDPTRNFAWQPKLVSQYDQEVIRLDYNATDIKTRLELHAQYPWLEAYLDKFDADCAVAEELADEAEEKKNAEEKRASEARHIGVAHRVTGRGRDWLSRRDRKKKFAYKKTNAAGRVKEDLKRAKTKPYQDWRKKKTGREHTPALAPRKRNDYFHELHDCLGLPYPDPKKYEDDLFVDWEEASVAFWKHKRPVFTWYGVKRILI